jgi:hypothetical protein
MDKPHDEKLESRDGVMNEELEAGHGAEYSNLTRKVLWKMDVRYEFHF